MSVTVSESTRVWARIGLLSFGGPAAQIALMHREIVEERKWLSEDQFLNALSFCMLLPGPEAMQLATYAGWRLHGTRGGLIAGLLFVLPGAVVILALATLYALLGQVPLVQALFLGVKAAVLVIVIEALLKVAKRALKRADHWGIAALSFIGIFVFDLPFPLIIGLSALYGLLRFTAEDSSPIPLPSSRESGQTILTWLTLWWGPILLILWLGHPMLGQIGLFFSWLAVVTFGGAYAVLAYMAQVVVSDFGWLDAGQMLDGLGLAETTPGPLILVTEFVGFLAGFGAGGIGLALAAAAVTLWATFVPCFLWIFTGAPYIEWLSHQPRLKGAMSAITAAVVGVILNLSIWFALHVLFAEVTRIPIGPAQFWQPQLATLDWQAALLSLVSALLIFGFRWSIIRVLLVAAVGGLALSAI